MSVTKTRYELKFGFYVSIILAVVTFITFCFAMIAIPSSGPYCPGDCLEYPYTDSLSTYPRDFYWLYLAVIQLIVFLIFTIAIHQTAPAEKKLNSMAAVSVAIISVTVLLIDYFIQFAVVPISLMKGETDGISLITQYNPHGIFIALEELGYLMMSLSLLFMAPVFSRKIRLDRTIRIFFGLPFILSVSALIYYTLKFGVEREYLFEVATITINWLAIITIGILVGLFFRKKLKDSMDNR